MHYIKNGDGREELDMDYFCFHRSTDQTYNQEFVDLFGPPRDPKANLFTHDQRIAFLFWGEGCPLGRVEPGK